MAYRLARNYGTCIDQILDGVHHLAGMGEAVLPGLSAAEVRYLVHNEFARTAEDILWRRTKLGLVAPPGATARLQAWLDHSGLAGD